MIPADPGGRFSPILSWISFSTRWSTNLPTTPPATAPTATDASSGGAKRPTATPDAAAPAHALAAAVVARLSHADAAVLGVRDQDDALDRDLLLLDERDQRLEVLRRLVDVLVAGDEHVGRCLSHRGSPFDPLRQDSSDAQVYLLPAPRLEGAGPAHVTL